jgi:hypothetical protein
MPPLNNTTERGFAAANQPPLELELNLNLMFPTNRIAALSTPKIISILVAPLQTAEGSLSSATLMRQHRTQGLKKHFFHPVF